MSVRANHVIRDRSGTTIFFEKNGADVVPMRFFWGHVAEAVEHIRANAERKDALMSDVWCEGASFVDLEARRLLFFGGGVELILRPWLRRVLVPVMRALVRAASPSEPPWIVEWAHEGIGTIADAAGIARATRVDAREPSRSPSDFDYERTLEELAAAPPPSATRAQTVLSLRSADGSMRDVGIPRARPTSGVGEVLAHGEAILAVLAARARLETLPEESRVSGGAQLDPSARTLSAWTARPDGTLRSRLERCWPGWSIDIHAGGFPEQIAGSGRDPAQVAFPLERAIEETFPAVFEPLYRDDPGPMVRLGGRLVDAGWDDAQPFVRDYQYGDSTRAPEEWRRHTLALVRRVVDGDGPRWV